MQQRHPAKPENSGGEEMDTMHQHEKAPDRRQHDDRTLDRELNELTAEIRTIVPRSDGVVRVLAQRPFLLWVSRA